MTAEFYETQQRDDYGRRYVMMTAKEDRKVSGVVVTMPKVYREHFPGERYLVNDWTKGPHEGVTYHAKRAEALDYLREVLTRELAARKGVAA
jgi:hypothetical protein